MAASTGKRFSPTIVPRSYRAGGAHAAGQPDARVYLRTAVKNVSAWPGRRPSAAGGFRWISLAVFGCLLLVSSAVRGVAQTPVSDTLTVVNWNLEWFADGDTHDPDVQVQGARDIMTALNADVYALCEIVNADSLDNLAASLPGGFAAAVSDFGSFADSRQDPDWAGAQKLALVYRTSKVRVLQSRALMAANPNAYYNFSSGRFPFLVRTEVKGTDNVWRALDFIVLHAKASSDPQSCQRRAWGAMQLKDTLDARFGSARFILLGDYNDDLDGTICSSGSISAYISLVQDSTDANSYRAVTLPLSRAGAYSLEGYSNLIDHQIISNELRSAHVPGSTRWLKPDVLAIHPSYTSTISDHYPILSKYVMNATTGLREPSSPDAIRIYPNPATTTVFVEGLDAVEIFSVDGRAVLHAENAPAGIDVSSLAPGAYFLRATREDGTVQSAPLLIRR